MKMQVPLILTIAYRLVDPITDWRSNLFNGNSADSWMVSYNYLSIILSSAIGHMTRCRFHQYKEANK